MCSKDSNKRADMKQRSHAPQHHRHHPALADSDFLLGRSSSGTDGRGSGVDLSMRSPPTAEVHFATSPSFPEEDNVEESSYNDSPHRRERTASPSSSTRRRMTAAAPSMSAFAAGESGHTGTGMPIREQQQQPQQSPPLGRSATDRENRGVSRRRPRSGMLCSHSAFAHKSPPAPLGDGSTGPLGGYMIQQGKPFRGGANDFQAGGPSASGGRGAGGHGGQQVR